MDYWTQEADSVIDILDSDARNGLSVAEAKERLEKFGPNRLVKERKLTFAAVFWEEIREPMILLLLAVGTLYSIWGRAEDAITIFSVITILVLVEIFTEYRAKKAVNALRRLSPATAIAVREGEPTRIPSAGLVPGDILLLKSGDLVRADARIWESYGIEADESTLTGESIPSPKSPETVEVAAAVADRTNLVYTGTTITRGKGRAVIVSTGMQTELGRIQGLVMEAKEPKTPLQLGMKQLAGYLVYIAILFSAIIPVIGIIQGKNYREMILTGLSLSFATIPEELPIIITMVLGVGAYSLSRQGVLVKRLKAAETLGSVTVIATDKTGTITENRMRLEGVGMPARMRVETFDPSDLQDDVKLLLDIGVLTSDVIVEGGSSLKGDPMEIAIFDAASSAGLDPVAEGGSSQLLCEFSFDNGRKLGSAVYKTNGVETTYTKGAPEAVLERSVRLLKQGHPYPLTEEERDHISRLVDSMAQRSMRVLAFAYKESSECLSESEAERELTFVGLAGFLDPPRENVRTAVGVTRTAGMRTIVISGDHPSTVEQIAVQVGIDTAGGVLTGADLDRLDDGGLSRAVSKVDIYARTTPEHKFRIVNSLRNAGEVVAVTGDGINDAPALKAADIGIAMGDTGTDVAKETADMVLTDDSFVSVVSGVRQGRKVFDNLSKGVRYYLACKLALVMVLLVPVVLNIPFPLQPIQIIILELFMDLAASATFVAEPAEDNLMRRPPRDPGRRFVDREMLVTILAGSLSLAAAVTFNYLLTYYTKGHDVTLAQTVAFGTWLSGHVLLAINMRSTREPLARLGLFTNKTMLAWATLSIGFFLLVTEVAPLSNAVRVVALDWQYWLAILGVTFIATFWMEARKLALSAMARRGKLQEVRARH